MFVSFNVNHNVRVKLNSLGRKLHREQFEELERKVPSGLPYRPPVEDADGWSQWQLWQLMQVFGGPNIGNGMEILFETNIEFDIEPLPCLKCGKMPLYAVNPPGIEGHAIACKTCRGQWVLGESKQDAFAKWNAGDQQTALLTDIR